MLNKLSSSIHSLVGFRLTGFTLFVCLVCLFMGADVYLLNANMNRRVGEEEEEAGSWKMMTTMEPKWASWQLARRKWPA